ncbi:hypothetical protein LFADAHJC_LOCUS705 [Methylorubrum extorquens]
MSTMLVVDGCWCVRSQTCVQIHKILRDGAMEKQQPEWPDQRNNALWLRLAVGSLLLCVLIFGCWQTADWLAAHFPRDFR